MRGGKSTECSSGIVMQYPSVYFCQELIEVKTPKCEVVLSWERYVERQEKDVQIPTLLL